jgi:hypothetical protein
VLPAIVRLIRTASIVICLIVIVSFVVFAVTETKSASGHQQAVLSEQPTSGQQSPVKHEGSVHKALDEASSSLTSPFSGIVSSSSSEWASRGVRLALALLVYGFGLGYLARAIRVRV